MAKKYGYQIRSRQGLSTKLRSQPASPTEDAQPGKEITKAIYDDNDSAAIRGTRKGFS